MKRILVTANDFPYPPDHGAAVDMWSRILILKEMGYHLDLLVTVRGDPDEDDIKAVRQQVDDLWIIRRQRGLKAVLSPLPFQVGSRKGLQDIVLPRRYDAILLEAEHVAALLKNPTAHGSKVILRIHNDEARYFRELSRGSADWKKKLFYRLESCKFRAYSPGVRSACDLLWFISELERREHVRRNPADEGKSFFLPPDIRPSGMRPFSARGAQALFIGTLTIPHNADAIKWYIAQIHPLLEDVEDYALMVAGHTGGAPIASLQRRIAAQKNVLLLENPKVLDNLYGNSAVFVNPVRRGAGLKLKVIQAIQAGLPVVTTSIGIEGTGLVDKKHLLVADQAEEFANCVRRLFKDHTLAESLIRAAQTFLAERYDMKANLQKSLSVFLR